ncbi:PAS domain-containing protein [Pseudomonas sp. dw_358]|uniref:PAS domain-containing protein n=1 Tax=Pseudomonas sp. dw_358 TaxID=2720083 RepID=UPI001BD40A6B|nr:PAS domain-containing protein [Pseudomonas sp. dw_358]
MPRPTQHSTLSFLSGGGHAGALIRQQDWARTPLGPASDWPASLQTLLVVLLGSRQPMFVAWGPARTLLYNDAYSQILEDRHPAAMGRDFLDVWHDVREQVLPMVERTYQGEAVQMNDISLQLQRHGQLEEAHFSFSHTPVRDADHQVLGFFCACQETTAQIISERRTIADSARQRRLFERAPGFVAILQGPEHVFEFANVAYSLLFGNRDFLGRSVREAFPELGGQRYIDWLDQVYRSGERLVSSHVPIYLVPDSGGPALQHFLDFIYEPVINDQGEVTGIFVQGYDVSQAHRAQQDLRVATDELRALNETLEARVAQRTAERDRVWRNSRDMLALIDRNEMLAAVNPAWREVLGYEAHELEGRRFLEFIWPEDVAATSHHFHEVAGVCSDVFENRYRHKDGTPRWISWQTVKEGDLYYAYGRHVTMEKAQAAALRHAEEHLRQAQKMETVGQLTGGIAHDFNNLLLGITGSLELIQKRINKGSTTNLERLIDGAMHSATRAAGLTHRLLAFARRQPLVPKPTDVTALLLGMEDLLQRTLGPQYQLDLAGAADLWPTLCDPHQLESAILNVVINARDAMPQGGQIQVVVSNQRIEADMLVVGSDISSGDYVSVCIQDHGTGMPADVRLRAIEPFFTTKPLGQGTGLGLSMVYGFAKQSEGHLDIQSRPGQGTSVAILLPRYGGELEMPVAPLEHREPGHHSEAVVLLVEDEPAIRQLITGSLEELGCTVFTAADGLTGLQLVESHDHFDLLITDLGLPGLNGRQLAERAVQLRPTLPVMIITGYAQDATLAKGFLTDGMEMMTKPFALTTFTRNVCRLLRRTGEA